MRKRVPVVTVKGCSTTGPVLGPGLDARICLLNLGRLGGLSIRERCAARLTRGRAPAFAPAADFGLDVLKRLGAPAQEALVAELLQQQGVNVLLAKRIRGEVAAERERIGLEAEAEALLLLSLAPLCAASGSAPAVFGRRSTSPCPCPDREPVLVVLRMFRSRSPCGVVRAVPSPSLSPRSIPFPSPSSKCPPECSPAAWCPSSAVLLVSSPGVSSTAKAGRECTSSNLYRYSTCTRILDANKQSLIGRNFKSVIN